MRDPALVHRLLTERLVLVARDRAFAITLRTDEDEEDEEGATIGRAALVAMEEPGLFGVDVELDAIWRRRGYATEAVGALARVALEVLGALRVDMPCGAGQLAVARRLGFRPVGRVRDGGGGPWVALWGVADLAALARVAPPVDALDESGAALAPVDRAEQERADWIALRDHLCEYYDVYADDESMDVVGEHCVVTLTVEKRGLRSWIVANAALPAAMEAGKALEANAVRSMATVATADGRYVLRRAMLFAASQPWVVRHCIRAFDQEVTGTSGMDWQPNARAATLAHYAD